MDNELTKEEQETWDELLKIYAPQKFEAGYFYCPYIPVSMKREALGLVNTDVS